MRVRTLPLVAVLLVPLLTVPPVVLSNQEVRILGVIVSIDNRQETFLIQELGSTAQGRTWSVRVTSGTVGRRLRTASARVRRPRSGCCDWAMLPRSRE